MSLTPPPSRSQPIAGWACLGAGLALFQVCGNAARGYIHTASLFHWWVFQWINPDSETQHAWLILALSTALAVRNFRRTPADSEEVTVSFAWAIGGALALHALAFRAEQPRLSILALLLFVWGTIGLIGGGRARRAATFPLGFLLFAIPVSALDTVGFWLRLMVVRAGSGLAHGMGINVVRSGTQLFAPDGRYQYDVAAACSGIRSLEAFFALSVLLGYLQLQTVRARALLVVACVPLILAGNVLRIVAIVLAASMGGQRAGEIVHDVMGYGVFVIVIVGLASFAMALENRPINRAKPPPPPRPAAQGWGAAAARAGWLGAAAAGAMIGLLAVTPPSAGRAGVTLNADRSAPADLPAFVGSDWIGRQIPTSEAELAILPKDTGFAKRLYYDVGSADQTRRVLLSIVLSGSDRSSIHRPEVCLIGQGWTIDETHAGTFAPSAGGRPGLACTVLKVHRDVRTRTGVMRAPELVAYCFVGHAKSAGSYPDLLWADGWNRVVHGEADRWAYVLLQTGATDGEAAALRRMQAILDGVSGSLFGHPAGS